MGLYKSRKSLYQRRMEGLTPTTIGPTDPEDFVEVKEEIVPESKIDSGMGKVVKNKSGKNQQS